MEREIFVMVWPEMSRGDHCLTQLPVLGGRGGRAAEPG